MPQAAMPSSSSRASRPPTTLFRTCTSAKVMAADSPSQQLQTSADYHQQRYKLCYITIGIEGFHATGRGDRLVVNPHAVVQERIQL